MSGVLSGWPQEGAGTALAGEAQEPTNGDFFRGPSGYWLMSVRDAVRCHGSTASTA
jgi:hypothetical protein